MKEIELYIKNAKYKGVARLGDQFYEFIAKSPTGESFDSRQIRKKIVLIAFWLSSCGPCVKDMPLLNKVYDKYHSLGLEIIHLSADDSEAAWKKASERHQPKGYNVSNLAGAYCPEILHYGVAEYPTYILFDKDKKINLVTSGEEVPLLESRIKELLGLK